MVEHEAKNQIEYSEEYVEKDKIECRREAKNKVSARYYLTIVFKDLENNPDSRKDAIVIYMMNPSCSNEKKSDATTNKLIKRFYFQYKKMILINTIPFVKTKIHTGADKKEILNICNNNKEMILRNQEIISSIIHRHPNAPILIATGSLKMKIMNQEYFDFIQKYNNLYVFGNSKEKFIENTGYPSHPIRLALARKDKNDKYVFDLLRKEEIDGYVIN